MRCVMIVDQSDLLVWIGVPVDEFHFLKVIQPVQDTVFYIADYRGQPMHEVRIYDDRVEIGNLLVVTDRFTHEHYEKIMSAIAP